MKNHSLIGFTLIELLIVVAIIAILAAIAVPNFLEAQTRAKIARVKNDFRTLDVSLSAYRVDNSKYPYPRGGIEGVPKNFLTSVTELTTPIAYITSVFLTSPFQDKNWGESVWHLGMSTLPFQYTCYEGWWANVCFAASTPRVSGWLLQCYGPSRMPTLPEWQFSSLPSGQSIVEIVPFHGWAQIYDATNGTTSSGELIRIGGMMQGAPQ